MSSDLPSQPSLLAPMPPGPSSQPSSLSSPPTQPVLAQTIMLPTDVLESLLTRAFSVAVAVAAPHVQAVAQPSIATTVTESTTPPPFVATPATVLPLGTSLFDRFPQVEAGTIMEITRHKFKPMDLFKLDPAIEDKNLE